MTLGVDTGSNSIVVSAPGPLVKEVEAVVAELDRRAMSDPGEDIAVVRSQANETPRPFNSRLPACLAEPFSKARAAVAVAAVTRRGSLRRISSAALR